MLGRRSAHDRSILDALEAIDREPFAGEVWRVTRKDRDPLRGSAAKGRWSPSGGEFEVLYTSLERDGALAEIGYRLSLEPVWPSRLEHEVHLIAVETERTLRFAALDSLAPLGVEIARYHTFEYQAIQAIAAAAYFSRVRHPDRTQRPFRLRKSCHLYRARHRVGVEEVTSDRLGELAPESCTPISVPSARCRDLPPRRRRPAGRGSSRGGAPGRARLIAGSPAANNGKRSRPLRLEA